MIELSESLTNLLKAEPKTAAAQEAKKLGLKYMGFGRYADKTGKLAYMVVKDKLVPYKKNDELQKMFTKADTEAERERLKAATEPPPKKPKEGEAAPKPKKSAHEFIRKEAQSISRAKSLRSKEDEREIAAKKKEIQQVDAELTSYYAGMFSGDEEAAINTYTENGFEQINSYLTMGHAEGTDYYTGKQLEKLVKDLDSAFEETATPFKYTSYTALSSRYNPDSFEIGKDYQFKGYVSSSLDFDIAGGNIGMGEQKTKTAKAGSGKGVMLELEVPKGAKAIHLPALEGKEPEYETLLPRGSKIRVVSGPHVVPAGAVGKKTEDASELIVFKCKIVQDS
jgi:hypothetical protein